MHILVLLWLGAQSRGNVLASCGCRAEGRQRAGTGALTQGRSEGCRRCVSTAPPFIQLPRAVQWLLWPRPPPSAGQDPRATFPFPLPPPPPPPPPTAPPSPWPAPSP